MKNFILKHLLFLCSPLLILPSCTENIPEGENLSPLDSVFLSTGGRQPHLIFICLSAYDCISCYKPVYDAILTFRCSNTVFITSSIREAEEKQFSKKLRDKTGLTDFTFIENPALFHDIYNRAGLIGPNTIAVFGRNGTILFSAALKNLSAEKLEELKTLYCR